MCLIQIQWERKGKITRSNKIQNSYWWAYLSSFITMGSRCSSMHASFARRFSTLAIMRSIRVMRLLCMLDRTARVKNWFSNPTDHLSGNNCNTCRKHTQTGYSSCISRPWSSHKPSFFLRNEINLLTTTLEVASVTLLSARSTDYFTGLFYIYKSGTE